MDVLPIKWNNFLPQIHIFFLSSDSEERKIYEFGEENSDFLSTNA